MSVENINCVLPLELLDTIFQTLPLADIKNVLLVCTLWKYLGEPLWLRATDKLKETTDLKQWLDFLENHCNERYLRRDVVSFHKTPQSWS